MLCTGLFFAKVTQKVGQMILYWKLILGNIKYKDTNRGKICSFYEKELLLNKLYMHNYPEPDSHISNEVIVILDLTNYSTKNN